MENQPSPNKLATMPKSPSNEPKSGIEFALRVLVALSECLPRQNGAQPLSAEALGFMAEGLAGLPADALKRAAGRARDSLRFMPTVAELRELAGCHAPKPEELSRAEELAAWDQAVAWVQCYQERLRNGRTGELGWSDRPENNWGSKLKPIAPLPARVEAALRRIGGPDAIQRTWGTPDDHWTRDRFCEQYRLCEVVDEKRLQLSGAEVLQIADRAAKALPRFGGAA